MTREDGDNRIVRLGRLTVVSGTREQVAPADAALFDRFVALHSAALLGTAWGLTGDRAHAEDLLQSTLERLWLHWGQVREKSGAMTYARRVMVSLFVTSRRRRWWNEHPSDTELRDEAYDETEPRQRASLDQSGRGVPATAQPPPALR